MMEWPLPPGRLSTDERLLVTELTELKLRRLVDSLDRMTWADGLDWYYQAHDKARSLGLTYGVTTQQAAAMIAALSPRNSWEDNVDDCEALLEDDDAITRAFGPNQAKAEWIKFGTDPEEILGGPKVRAFYRNIAFPDTSLDVTLDSWMGRVLGLPNHYAQLEQGYLSRRGVYDHISDGFRSVAGDHAVMPHQLQAAVWLHARERKN